jgi:hypothetical protein
LYPIASLYNLPMTQMRKKSNDRNINLIYYFSCIITQRTTISSWFHKFKLQKSDRFVLQKKNKKTLKQKAKSQKIERIKRKNKKNSPLQIEDWRFLNTMVKGASNQSKVIIFLSLLKLFLQLHVCLVKVDCKTTITD